MKKIILILIATVFSFAGYSQKLASSKVPQMVKDGLKKAHPSVTPTWEFEEANYEANFTEAGKTVSCILNKQGTILETETVITIADLPKSAKSYIDTHYKGKKIQEIARIEKPGSEINYEVVLSGTELIFDSNGTFKKVEKGEKEKD